MARTLVALVIAVVLGPQPPRPVSDPAHPGPKMTVKLVVTGPRLERELTITDPAAIKANVFGGNFMTTFADPPDASWPRYRVAFHIDTLERRIVLAYAVQFARNPRTGEGFVYLPGRGDTDDGLNISTVRRDGSDSPGAQPARDGHWHHATADWSAALNARLPAAR